MSETADCIGRQCYEASIRYFRIEDAINQPYIPPWDVMPKEHKRKWIKGAIELRRQLRSTPGSIGYEIKP